MISSSADRVGGVVKYLSIMPSSSEQLHSVAVRSGSALRARILWPLEINCAGIGRAPVGIAAAGDSRRNSIPLRVANSAVGQLRRL